MLGGADNPNGELPSYITGADIKIESSFSCATLAMSDTNSGDMLAPVKLLDRLKQIITQYFHEVLVGS